MEYLNIGGQNLDNLAENGFPWEKKVVQWYILIMEKFIVVNAQIYLKENINMTKQIAEII